MTTLSRDKTRGSTRAQKDPLVLVADGLVSKLPSLGSRARPAVLKALHELLDGVDEAARITRTQMQKHLIEVADSLLSSAATDKQEEHMLTTEEAAKIMQCSRPYVAMLIDQGQLPGAMKTAGGHRKVPQSSVEDWVASHTVQGSADYRAAAREAGMYAIPEIDYVKALATRNKRKNA